MRRPSPPTNAGPSALQGVRPRSNQNSSQRVEGTPTPRLAPPRVIVPQLEDLAAELSNQQLQSVRAQVQPGEQVALYRAGDTIRVLLIGRQRLWQHAPRSLKDAVGTWTLIGAVEITEDGERALPLSA